MLTYRSMLRFSLPRDASYLARSDTPLRRAVRFLLFAEDTVAFGGMPLRCAVRNNFFAVR